MKSRNMSSSKSVSAPVSNLSMFRFVHVLVKRKLQQWAHKQTKRKKEKKITENLKLVGYNSENRSRYFSMTFQELALSYTIYWLPISPVVCQF